MTPEMIMSIARETLLTAMLLAAPPLGIGLLVGLVISIFQAVTQVQEQTLTFVPKIFAILLSLLIFGPWMLKVLNNFAVNILSNLNNIIS
ncbi:MAG: flagellar biosynthesis protein FliQ [Syntrophomonadaceae bacterium]|nr:flagellar biosynthesis protein FliQ [Syntrophomonadaceae bacterium]